MNIYKKKQDKSHLVNAATSEEKKPSQKELTWKRDALFTMGYQRKKP